MPLKDLENHPIFCRDVNTESQFSFALHKHPFTSLPYLKSHIRPQFAIFNAGLKFKRALQMHKDLIESSPDLIFVVALYEAWIRELPYNHKQDQSYFPPAHDNDDDEDDEDDILVDDEDEDLDYDD